MTYASSSIPGLALFLRLLIGLLCLGGCASAADLDSLREPVIRPNEETVKRWLYNFEIVVEKRSLWFDRKAKIEPSKILNLTTSGGSVFQKLPPMANYAVTTRAFEYPDGKGRTNKYVVVIEYEWKRQASDRRRSPAGWLISSSRRSSTRARSACFRTGLRPTSICPTRGALSAATRLPMVALCLEPANPRACRRRRQSPRRCPAAIRGGPAPRHRHPLPTPRRRHLLPPPRPRPDSQTRRPAPLPSLLNPFQL